MRLTSEEVAEIRAAEGVYRASDVARAYDVHRSTVTRIWGGSVHEAITPSTEPPNIVTKNRPVDLAEDVRLLAQRGLSAMEIAQRLGISKSSVYVLRGVFV